MPILKRKNASGNANNILAITDGAGLCPGDNTRSDYTTGEIDITGTTVSQVNVTVPGGSAATVALDNAPIDWKLPANDAALKADLEKVATDLGYLVFDKSFELIRGAADTDLTVKFLDSTLIFNWIGTTTSDENALTASQD